MAERHYDPAKDTDMLDDDDYEDMDVDDEDEGEVLPLVKAVKSHVQGCLSKPSEPRASQPCVELLQESHLNGQIWLD